MISTYNEREIMIPIDYVKRNNTKLFKRFATCDELLVDHAMNYNPIYHQFFSLNEHNHNCINLKQKWIISDVDLQEEKKENNNDENELITILGCTLLNLESDKKKTKDSDVFFKIAPLLNPFQYLLGRYDLSSNYVFPLPSLQNNEQPSTDEIVRKVNSTNNVAYIDGFFCFLSNYVFQTYNFVNALEYYGSFIGMKTNYKFDVCDDICVLMESEYFVKNKDILYSMYADDYDKYCQHPNFSEQRKQQPICIGNTLSLKSIGSVDGNNVTDTNDIIVSNDLEEILIEPSSEDVISLCDNEEDNDSCSSRTSNTSSSSTIVSSEDNDNEEEDNDDNDAEEDNNTYASTDEDDFEEQIIVTIPQFPVNVICMEACFETYDALIGNEQLSVEEWYASLFQVIMILTAFQKMFDFTHNDLHTNNIMYNETSKTHLYYKLDDVVYKVPTFGRIFKIIDFGRSIYHVNGQRFCSDSFEKLGDADTQYNSEPYFNPKKERIEPNYSFDICRLACSIFDYLIEDINEIHQYKECNNIASMDYVKRIIIEWCSDDKGRNILYKSDGSDRYPGFKLYKMIARDVHHCVPKMQLSRPPFQQFICTKMGKNVTMMDIDKIPSYR